MGMKGKGRKRREANFKASHPEAANRLAPPPATKDVNAIPSKLRKIMKFKETGSMSGQVNAAVQVDQSKNQGKEPKKKKDAKQDIVVAKQDDKKMATDPSTGKQPPPDGQVAEKDAKPLNKRRRETAELLQFAEKLQAKPARTGMKSNRKKYLQEKKKKRLSNSTYEAMLREPEKEKIEFGDIVQEPPKLSFPAKAKITMKEERPASHERVRLLAIEAYRQRKSGGSRLGKGPALVERNDDAISE